MHLPSYISYRADTKTYKFRWTVPLELRSVIGRTEITKSLNTDNKRLAMRLARRLAVMLERTKITLMANKSKDDPKAALTAKLVERLVDGTVRIEGLGMDPDPAKAEEERRHLAALLGAAAPVEKRPDERTLGDLVKAYLEHGKRANLWTERTAQELEHNHLRLMLDVMGENTLLSTLSRKDFAEFKDVLMRLPANKSKSPLYRDKSILELRAMKIPDSHRMSVITINNKLQWVSATMEWGTRHGYVSANFAEGLTLPKAKRDSEHRQAYTDEEVLKMKDALLSGAHGAAGYPWRKWIPLLLAYQGARLGEMAQLRVQDIGEIDGIPTITITADAGSIKTEAAARTIPIHPELIRLGFLDYVSAMRKRGVARVFPELPKRRNGYGTAVSRWWGDTYRHKIGLSHQDLHAFRHTVATKLREADVPEDVVQEILGHERGESESFRRYAKGSTQARLLSALSKVAYGEPAAKTEPRLVSGG